MLDVHKSLCIPHEDHRSKTDTMRLCAPWVALALNIYGEKISLIKLKQN